MAVSHAYPKSNLAVAKEHSVKAGLCKEARTKQCALCCGMLFKQQATGNLWSLYSFEGYLPYKRDTAKITKITTT